MLARIIAFSARNLFRIVMLIAAIVSGGLWAVARLTRGRIRYLSCAGVLLLAGCSGVQSALDPAGREAERIAALFWWMVAGTVVVWLVVISLALYCVRARAESFSRRRARLIIVGGGAVVPTMVLAVLLVFGLGMLPGIVAPAPAGSLTIAVNGELWWWRRAAGIVGLLLTSMHMTLLGALLALAPRPLYHHAEEASTLTPLDDPHLGGAIMLLIGGISYLAGGLWLTFGLMRSSALKAGEKT